MKYIRKLLNRDVLFLSLLLLIAAVPLVVLRGTTVGKNIWLLVGSSICWLIVSVLWLTGKGSSISQRDTQSRGDIQISFKRHQGDFLWYILLTLTLLAFTIVAFYLPMMQHWWSGTDEGLTAGINTIWYEIWDEIHARPLAALPYYIALHLTPNSYDGYLWINVFLRFASSLLVYGLVRELFKSGRLLAIIAALLFIVNPSEHIRFIVGSICYYSSVFFFLLAVWLYFVSHRKQSRLLLILSCITLGASLLQYETPFPLSVLVPIILHFINKKSDFASWAFAWYGTVALFAARFLHHMFTDELLYHVMLLKAGNMPTTITGLVGMIFTNLLIQLEPVFEYAYQFKGISDYWLKGLIALLPAIPLLFWSVRQNRFEAPPKITGWSIILTVIALVLSISPFVVLPIAQVFDFREYPTMRFQFYAAPVQAILWALLISYIGSLLKRRGKQIFSVAMVSILVVASVAGAYRLQSHHGFWNPQTDLKTTSRVFHQTRAVLPEMKDRSYGLFFVIDDRQDSPMGWAYGIFHLSCLIFGVPGYQGHITPEGNLEYRTLTGYAREKYVPAPDCTMVVVQVSPDWRRVELLEVRHPKGQTNNVPCPACMARFLNPPPDRPLPFLQAE